MKCVDWRDADPGIVGPLYRAEQARWSAELDWDATAHWIVVEAARVQGTLPGYLAIDETDAVVGWAFYHLHDDVLQIGGLTGSTHAVARTLLNTILRSPEAARARDVACFVLPDQPTTTAFVQRRFEALTFLYLRRELDGHEGDAAKKAPHAIPSAQLVGPWTIGADAPDTVRLMAEAYGTSAAARCFAGRSGQQGWVDYVRQLIRSPACGVFLPSASFAARGPDGALCGVVLTTTIGSQTGHIAQLVVDPAHARQGVGRHLLERASDAVAREGRRYLTLLVAEDNAPALALYERAGFSARSRFLFGIRPRPIPRRSSATAAA